MHKAINCIDEFRNYLRIIRKGEDNKLVKKTVDKILMIVYNLIVSNDAHNRI